MSSLTKYSQLMILVMLTSVMGCSSLYDGHYEKTQKFRTWKAWYGYTACSDECYGADYRSGWKAGYYDVLTGGCGKPPLIAPKKYWCPSQITRNCDLNRYEWYVGFNDGANCARTKPDTHYLKVWMPEYCDAGVAGTPIEMAPLELSSPMMSGEGQHETLAPLAPVPSLPETN